ncbi:hypothetical protein ABZW30_05375 [Kitasatospora sp. NPDC004669]|uniref:hypothetical protein n=1 Tax=Kitasatospora sp. NPDC004669 TaxID=3154555 RepID=UPI0033BA7CA6
MANCASCGATSVEGASVCGSCGRPPAPPSPTAVALPAVPPTAPGYGQPPTAPPGYYPPPGQGAGYPPVGGPPAVGSWGAGQPYYPKTAQSPVLRWLAGSNWRPALVAAIGPTVVLLVAALIAAVPGDYDYDGAYAPPDFGDRFGAALAMALNALGAPFRIGANTGSSGHSLQEGMELTFRVLPLTVTVFWALALWLGLRARLRRRKADGTQLTRTQAAGEALRSAVVLAAVTLLLGLLAGTDWNPGRPGGYSGFPDYSDSGGRSRAMGITADSTWLEAVGWTALLAFLLAFAVYGTDALRWAAWRSRSVRGWALAALTAGQALALSVALSSVAAFVLVAVNAENGATTAVSLAFLPNLGLQLLGFGSGATFSAHVRTTSGDTTWGNRSSGVELSFFDLHDASADWRWCGLAAVVAALLLGWAAYRRQLDAADRLRLAAVYTVVLTLLMTVAGALLTRTVSMAGWTSSVRSEMSEENSVGLVFLSVLVANAVWAVVGAVLVPAAMAALGGRGAAAPYGAAPPGAYGAVPPQVPYPTGPAYGVPPQGMPPQGMPPVGVPPQGAAPYAAPQGRPQDAPPEVLGAGVSEVIGSHEAPATPAAGTPLPADAPRPPEEPVDPSVWRDHP